MDAEAQASDALVQELLRQAEVSEGRLQVVLGDGSVHIEGDVDTEALAMVIVGSLAGGP